MHRRRRLLFPLHHHLLLHNTLSKIRSNTLPNRLCRTSAVAMESLQAKKAAAATKAGRAARRGSRGEEAVLLGTAIGDPGVRFVSLGALIGCLERRLRGCSEAWGISKDIRTWCAVVREFQVGWTGVLSSSSKSKPQGKKLEVKVEV